MLMSANSRNSLVTKSGLVTSHVPPLQTPPTQEVPSGRFRSCDSPNGWNGWHTESFACDLQQILQSLSSVQKHWIMPWSSQKLKHFKEVLFVLFSLGRMQEPLCVCAWMQWRFIQNTNENFSTECSIKHYYYYIRHNKLYQGLSTA